MQSRQTVYVGKQPPSGRAFDWVVEPSARVTVGGEVAAPDIALVKQLLGEATPVVESITSDDPAAFLRDEIFQLVLSTARAEATLRTLADTGPVTIVASQHLPRPSRPRGLGEGLARFLGAELEWSGGRRPRWFPAGLVGSGRAQRWSRGRRLDPGGVVLAVGGPSEKRALAPVAGHLGGAWSMLDFGLRADPELASFGAFLGLRDAVRPVGSRSFADGAARVWGSADWWGAKWLPWVKSSIRVMSHITLREAALFHAAATRALDRSQMLVTAKVRFARARAILAAARDLGVPTLAIQHGMYVDGPEWSDLRADVFGVSGDSFAGVLERRGYTGEVIRVGAPFYEVPDRSWECGIALQPPEGVVITSPADYEHHATTAFGAARSVLGDDAAIGFRLHPREDESRLRDIVGGDVEMTRDHTIGARMWVSIESSFVVEAVLSGAPTVLVNLNGHPWEYRFAEMPGSRVATDASALESALRTMDGAETGHVEAWQSEFAVASGEESAARVAAVIEERLR